MSLESKSNLPFRNDALDASDTEDAIVQSVLELYQTILRMSNRSTDTLKIAPPGGHELPKTFESELQKRKSPQTIQFLRRLPYITCGLELKPSIILTQPQAITAATCRGDP